MQDCPVELVSYDNVGRTANTSEVSQEMEHSCMGGFILRHPKVAVSYLSTSPVSVLSTANITVSEEEIEEYVRLSHGTTSPGEALARQGESEFSDQGTATAKDGNIWSHPTAQKDQTYFPCLRGDDKSEARASVVNRAGLPRFCGSSPLTLRTSVFGYDRIYIKSAQNLFRFQLRNPRSVFSLLVKASNLRARLAKKPKVIEENPSQGCFWKGDIIVCIRDGKRPQSENLVRAYAVSSELLGSTMSYFRPYLTSPPVSEESSSLQVSLFMRKDLWEWVLHTAKIEFQQTHEPHPVIALDSALPLFAATVTLGMEAGKDLVLNYIKRHWPGVVLKRNKSLDDFTEKGLDMLAEALTPDYFEECGDQPDWLVGKLFDRWWTLIFHVEEDPCALFFPYGTAVHMFYCAYCYRWMNRRISHFIPCEVPFIVRDEKGKLAHSHTT